MQTQTPAQTLFTFRAPASFVAETAKLAKRVGLTRSEYARRAIEEMNQRLMHERIGGLSRALAAQSAAANRAMDGSLKDGLGG